MRLHSEGLWAVNVEEPIPPPRFLPYIFLILIPADFVFLLPRHKDLQDECEPVWNSSRTYQVSSEIRTESVFGQPSTRSVGWAVSLQRYRWEGPCQPF